MTNSQIAPSGLEIASLQDELLASLAEVKQRTDCALTNAGVLSELLRGSGRLPEAYVQPEEERAATVWDFDAGRDLELPLVDISIFEDSSCASDASRAEALVKIANSCKTWGFVQIIGHGVDTDTIRTCEEQAHRLFQLPVSVKDKALRPPGTVWGYGANFWLNMTSMNWAESFHVNKFNAREYAAKLWPTDCDEFSSAIEKYIEQIESLGHKFRRILTEGLGVPADHFDEHFGESDTMVNLRLNFYPPCPEPSKALGQKAHRDPHFFTVLLQDNVAGLQIWNEEKKAWFNVKPIPGSFVINVGDIFQAASNGVYKSVLHRAVVNERKCRLSMACFYNTKATLVAPDQLITSERPQKYRSFSWGEYIKEAYTNNVGSNSLLDMLFSRKSTSFKV